MGEGYNSLVLGLEDINLQLRGVVQQHPGYFKPVGVRLLVTSTPKNNGTEKTTLRTEVENVSFITWR